MSIVLIDMEIKINIKFLLYSGITLGLGLLYTAGIFASEERILPETSAYIDGATPIHPQEWEMF